VTRRRHALQDLTWLEFRDRLAQEPVILLPLGSQEEQGPHAPMGDYVLAEQVALMAAERAEAICAPVLPFGHAEFFRGAPGGIQLRAATFQMVLEDMIGAFLDHGLTRIVVCNGHTTNGPLISQVTHKIRRERGLVVPSVNLWRALPESEWTRLHGESASRARGHGADPLTSVYMHLMPGSIRLDRLRQPPVKRKPSFGLASVPFSGVIFNSGGVDLPLDALEVADNGIGSGDPSCASAEIGAGMVEWLVEWLAAFATHFRRCDPRNPAIAPEVRT